MVNQIKYIDCEDLKVMASIEGQTQNKHPFYQPAIVLFYIKKGTMIVETDGQTERVTKGNFLLLNRYSHGFMEKSWTPEEGNAHVFAFAFHQRFIEKVKNQFPEKLSNYQAVKSTYVLPPNHVLKGLFDSLFGYIQQKGPLDTSLIELKTLEGMMGVLNFHPECHPVFNQELSSEKVNLPQLIENNYMYNISLKDLADLSGRSLSTFSRDFKAIYKESPHRWIRKRRLIRAKELLLNTNRKPIEFYLDLGFESLAHFSRAFKKEFGMTLTDYRKNNQSRIK